MPEITINTDDLPEGFRTAASLRLLARDYDGEWDGATAAILCTLAAAMPVPLPTAPGSQVRCDGDEWTLVRGELWLCYTSARGLLDADFADLGPFEVIRDAGEA